MSQATATELPGTSPLTRAQKRAQRLADLRAKVVEFGGNPDAVMPPDPVVEQPAEPEDLPRAEASLSPARGVQEGRLAALAHEINTRFSRADRADTQANDHRLAAAINIAEARRICDERKLNFRAWAEESIGQRFDFVRKMSIVGAAEDPARALADLRAANAAANKKMRERKAFQPNPFQPNPFKPKENPGPTPQIPQPAQPPEDRGSSSPHASAEAQPAAEGISHLPPPRPQDVAQPAAAAEAGLDDVGLFHALPMMDEEQRRALADKAAKGLPAQAARAHVEAVAAVLGLAVEREEGSPKFYVTFDSLVRDFTSLSLAAKRDFVAWAAHEIGALIEMPAA